MMNPFSVTRFLHTGLLVFGLLAWFTSEWAESYQDPHHLGFTLHRWLGMGLVAFILMRLTYGMMGPPHVHFSQLLPFGQDRLAIDLERWSEFDHLATPNEPHSPRAVRID